MGGGETLEQRRARRYRAARRPRFGSYTRRDVIKVVHVFQDMDKDHDGEITLAELKENAKRNPGASAIAGELESMFSSIDGDGSGSVDMVELSRLLFPETDFETQRDIASLLLSKEKTPEEVPVPKMPKTMLNELRELFTLYDKDGSGTLTWSELKDAMSANDAMYSKSCREFGVSADELKAMIAAVDADDNGTLDVQEFIEMIKDT